MLASSLHETFRLYAPTCDNLGNKVWNKLRMHVCGELHTNFLGTTRPHHSRDQAPICDLCRERSGKPATIPTPLASAGRQINPTQMQPMRGIVSTQDSSASLEVTKHAATLDAQHVTITKPNSKRLLSGCGYNLLNYHHSMIAEKYQAQQSFKRSGVGAPHAARPILPHVLCPALCSRTPTISQDPHARSEG